MSLPPDFKGTYYQRGEKIMFRGEPLTTFTKEELIAMLAWKLEQKTPESAADAMMRVFGGMR